MNFQKGYMGTGGESSVHHFYEEEPLIERLGLEVSTRVLIDSAQKGIPLPNTPDENKVEGVIKRNAKDWGLEISQKALDMIGEIAQTINAGKIDANKPKQFQDQFIMFVDEIGRENIGKFQQLLKQIMEKENEITNYKAIKKIARAARIGNKSKVWLTSIGLSFLEAMLNAWALFSAGYDGGLLAGFGTSVFVGASNLVAGFLLGEFFIPYSKKKNTRSTSIRLAYRSATAIMMGAALAINVWFSLLRVDMDVKSLLSGSLNASVLGFIIIGLAIVYIISRKFLMADDSDKEFGRLSRQEIGLASKAEHQRESIRSLIWSKSEEANQYLDEMEKEAQHNLNSISHALAECSKISAQVESEKERITEVHASLIDVHRSAVIAARLPNTPEYFKAKGDLSGIMEPSIELGSLKSHVQSMHGAYEKFKTEVSSVKARIKEVIDSLLANLNDEHNRTIDDHSQIGLKTTEKEDSDV